MASDATIRHKGTLLRKQLDNYEVILGDETLGFTALINNYGSAKRRLSAAHVMEPGAAHWVVVTGEVRPRAFIVHRKKAREWLGPTRGKVAVVGMLLDCELVPSIRGLEVDFYTGVES